MYGVQNCDVVKCFKILLETVTGVIWVGTDGKLGDTAGWQHGKFVFLPTRLPIHELKKDNNNRHSKVAMGKARGFQHYAK